MSEHDHEEIDAQIESVEEEIRRITRLPIRFQIHGQTVDNTERLSQLRSRLRHLRARRNDSSIFEGPDLEV